MSEVNVLWTPSQQTIDAANITRYSEWLLGRGKRFPDYPALWDWSVSDLEGFWESIWEYFGVEASRKPERVLGKKSMPGAEWFPGAELNFARHLFGQGRDGGALVALDESGGKVTVSWEELRRKTANLARRLRDMGVGSGDTVGAYLPNSAEAVIGFLAAASVGAVWTSCSPDFGARAVLDRFTQADPKVLLAVPSYTYGGKTYSRVDEVRDVSKALPRLGGTVAVGEWETDPSPGSIPWEEATSGAEPLTFEEVPFAHPLWILYSSGTTGLPKPIVHGHGGILLEHLKELSLHNDLREGDRFFWFTTTGWMMWNYLVGGLLHGATLLLFDGSPAYPGMDALWNVMERERATFMGTSAAFISASMKAGADPSSTHRLGALRGVGSTGSPLDSAGFEWVYGHVKQDLWLASLSGGTDVCTAFVGGNPTLPVVSGEIQCRCLGAKVEAFDTEGRQVVDEMGELVVTEPMPSMPVRLLGDTDGSRYLESYFEVYPGVWRHGDWVTITGRGTCVIHGRSDATIKRSGIRIGTSEIYRTVESMHEVADSLAIDVDLGRGDEIILFVVLQPGKVLDGGLEEKVREKIRAELSRRYIPDRIAQVPAIPRTLSGKKLEVPVKRLFMGADPDRALNRGSLQAPEAVDGFVRLAAEMRAKKL